MSARLIESLRVRRRVLAGAWRGVLRRLRPLTLEIGGAALGLGGGLMLIAASGSASLPAWG